MIAHPTPLESSFGQPETEHVVNQLEVKLELVDRWEKQLGRTISRSSATRCERAHLVVENSMQNRVCPSERFDDFEMLPRQQNLRLEAGEWLIMHTAQVLRYDKATDVFDKVMHETVCVPQVNRAAVPAPMTLTVLRLFDELDKNSQISERSPLDASSLGSHERRSLPARSPLNAWQRDQHQVASKLCPA